MTSLTSDHQIAERLKRLSPARRAVLERMLASRAETDGASDRQALTIRSEHERRQLSFAEGRLWFLSQLQPLDPFYNMPMAARLRGSLDADCLRRALEALIARHDILRTTYPAEGGQPSRAVAPAGMGSAAFTLVDLSSTPAEKREEALAARIREEARRPFDLERGPLLRTTLYRLSQDEHVVLLAMHHIISDGWSMGVMLRELATIYQAMVDGQPPRLLPTEFTYGDFAAWQRERFADDALEADLAYWRETLCDVPPLVGLQTDRPRPAQPDLSGARLKFQVPLATLRAARQLATERQTTLFVVLLAALDTLLARHARQDDICIGTPVANRTPPETEELIGFFVNTLVMRSDLSGDPSFAELVDRVRQVAVAAYEHQQLPFERLVELLDPERNQSQSPLFQVALVLQNAPFDLPLGEQLNVEPMAVETGTAKSDLAFFFQESASGLDGYVEYQTALFDEGTVAAMVEALGTLLEAAVATPEMPISRLPLVNRDVERRVVEEWNATDRRFPEIDPDRTCLDDLVEAQARAFPDRPAIRCHGNELTYAELDRRASQIASRLRSLGVVPESRVAVLLPRSIDWVVALLGVVKSGGGFVAIDPDQPRERIERLLADAQPKAVVTADEWLADLQATEIPTLLSADALSSDEAQSKLAGSSRGHSRATGPASLAYMIYTSGSTGQPKGVLVEHRGIVNFLRAQAALLGVSHEDRILQLFAPSFDGAVSEIFLTLTSGACLVIADREIALNAEAIEELVANEQVTLAKFTPTLLELLKPERLKSVRTLISAGEALSGDLVNRWAPNRAMFNGYGPTETTVGACMYCQPARIDRRPAVGPPLANVRIYVLDSHSQIAPPGMPGEIHIGGAGVARGYHNDPVRTAERFLHDPFSSLTGARMYKSGDLGRWRPDGVLEVLGRVDDQVKLRGYRVEPGEIAAVLQEHADVEQSVVVIDENDRGLKRLVAYVVPSDRAAKGESQQFDSQYVDSWRDLFNDMHQRAAAVADPTFDISGWMSSYTERPLPAEEMRVWFDRTVERILSLGPRRVLEIGVGTGLFVFRLAPHCENFTGTDFSAESLDRLKRLVEARPELAQRVTLVEQPAHEAGSLPQRSFDVAVLNSVVQYFPSVEYLLAALECAAERVRPGGQLFVGDVRNLPLHTALATSIELARADDQTPIEELRRRVRARLDREKELLVDPGLFQVLHERVPRVAAASIQLKRGPVENELTRFRYDVVLDLDESQSRAAGRTLAWDVASGSLDTLRAELVAARGETLAVRGVPNARVAADVAAWRLLESQHAPPTAHALRNAAAQCTSSAIKPDDLWQLADELGLDAEITCAASGEPEMLDVVFFARQARTQHAKPGDQNGAGRLAEPSTRRARAHADRDWSRFGNQLSEQAAARQLVPQLRAWARDRLPEYMLPSAIVVLPAIPRTAHGKVDRAALPVPPSDRPADRVAFVAPRDEHEQLVAAVWEELLGVRPIGIRDDFFDLGGHSMLAVQVMAEIERRSGRRLPLAALFQDSTVAHLAELLGRPEQDRVASSLVPLRATGERPPLFLIHPAGGTVFCYRTLVEKLDGDRPMYGLQAVGVDGLASPHRTAIEMAAHYVAAMRTAQPQGPYHVCGWSIGGNLAFEVACQLAEQGEEVGLVALLDAGAIPPDKPPSEEEFLPLLMTMFPDQDHLPLEALRAMDPADQLAYFLDRASRAGLLLPNDPHVGRYVFDVFQANVKAMLECRPRPYPGRVVLFRAAQQAAGVSLTDDPQLGWSRWAAGGVETHVVEGDHLGMMREPHIGSLAALLDRCLMAADAGASAAAT